jgi:hypothetical protein
MGSLGQVYSSQACKSLKMEMTGSGDSGLWVSVGKHAHGRRTPKGPRRAGGRQEAKAR